MVRRSGVIWAGVLGGAAWLGAAAGCTGFEPALVGAAAAAGQTGAGVWQANKLNAAERAGGEAVRDAVVAACAELGFRVGEVLASGDAKWTVHAYDQRDHHYALRVTERTPEVTHLQIDVGWFGSRAVAELMLESVRGQLGEARAASGGAG